MNDIFSALKALSESRDARGILVEIIDTEGSAPRYAGTRMFLAPDGTFSGTVGGGGLEYHAQREARRVLASGAPCRRTYSLGSPRGEDIGAICGGSATLDFRPIGPAEAAVLLAETPPPPRVLLYGAGHVGKALADALYLLDMDVIVTDERPEVLTEARFPHAARRLLPFAEAPVDAAASDLVAIMTHGHAYDYALGLRALRSPARYVGLIGSRKKSALFRRRFLEDGIPQEEIDRRLRSPIGLDIGAETPEEIAVSIAAEMISLLRSK